MGRRIVLHPDYGHGEFTATEAHGLYLHVHFRDGQTRKIRLDQVKYIGTDVAPTPDHSSSKREASAIKMEAARSSRKIVEALRMGIVPDAEVTQFTFGRDKEISKLRAWLDNPKDNTRFIVGAYGAGKTHLLHHLRTVALQAGFAVALVEIDAQETPFSRPKRVYRQIVQNLRVPVPGKPTQGFRDFLRRVRREGLLGNHPFFRYIQPNTRDEHIWHWIECCEDVHRPQIDAEKYTYLPGLYSYGTAANIYCNLLSGLGWACTQRQIGLKGLLLIFDEAETLFARARPNDVQQSYNFLEALVAVANNISEMKKSPKDTNYIFARYAENIPFQYRNPSGLKLAVAFTDTDALRDSLIFIEKLYLSTLNDRELMSVFEKVCQLYQEAYDFDTSRLSLDELYRCVIRKTGITRHRIKGFIEALDLARFYPHAKLGELLR